MATGAPIAAPVAMPCLISQRAVVLARPARRVGGAVAQGEAGIAEQSAPHQHRVRPAVGHQLTRPRQVAVRSDRGRLGVPRPLSVSVNSACTPSRTGARAARSRTTPPDEMSRRSMPTAASPLANVAASSVVQYLAACARTHRAA